MNFAQRLLGMFSSIRGGYKADRKRRYHFTGDELREARKRNGVGRPPAVNRHRAKLKFIRATK